MGEFATDSKMFRTLAVLLVMVALPSCYYYAPSEERVANPEARIRVHLAEPRDLTVGEDIVVRDVVGLDGYPLRWTADTLLVRTSVLRRTGDRTTSTRRGEVFELTPVEYERIEARHIDARKSALVAGGIAVGAVGIGALLFGGDAGGGEGENPEPEPPDEMDSRILNFVLSIPLPGGG